ncbi:hypothetical protein ACE6H2_002871 [Prunus campanulata]
MDERSDVNIIGGDKMDEVMLPGFRFHPTDEELVGFYLKRKIQQRPLSIELIKQLDIYKFDPWDLPRLMGNMQDIQENKFKSCSSKSPFSSLLGVCLA